MHAALLLVLPQQAVNRRQHHCYQPFGSADCRANWKRRNIEQMIAVWVTSHVAWSDGLAMQPNDASAS